MRKLVIFSFSLVVLLWWAPGVCLAQQPSEGYIRTADGVRLFYKIVGSGPETLVAVHGGPGNSLESIRPDLEALAEGRRVIYYDQRGKTLKFWIWCRRGDSNPHELPHTPLKRARLPVPPLRQRVRSFQRSRPL